MSQSAVGGAPREHSTEPLDAEAAGPATPPRVKRCPVCGRTYPREERYYCSYHTAVLVEDAPLPTGADETAPAASHPRRRRLRWALGALALAAALTLGYSVYSHRSWWASLLPAAQSGTAADYPLEVTTAAVVGGGLKGREVNLPVTEYPAAAKLQGVTGTVRVEVRADRAGRVAAARALDGPEALWAAAEEAARKARFKARGATGRAGTIQYDFMLCRDSGDCL